MTRLPESLKIFTARENTSKKLLRSLEMLNYLYNNLKKGDLNKQRTDAEEDKEKQNQPAQEVGIEEQIAKLMIDVVEQLRPTWVELSKSLEKLEKLPDSHHSFLCLQEAVEAFFLCYSLVIPVTTQSTVTLAQPSSVTVTQESSTPRTQESSVTASEPHMQQNVESTITATSESTVNRPVIESAVPTPATPVSSSIMELSKYQKEMFTFAEKHRYVLNQILRGNSNTLDTSAFAIFTHFPKLLDFDVKRKYFYKELKKMDNRDRYRNEDIAIRVRRSHIFGDSFRELHRIRNSDWKARFYIIFEGEEGQDAGGLLREWYQVITREIFNPNYALFINAPGDRVTYMINKSSNVNPEHLEYFQFVGRLIAKAIYDNKQLDCYFTRAFYKHILNIHVRYQDIESEDPEIYKSLVFLLNNSIEDLGTELTFTVEVDEFGVRSSRQLKENGSKIIVTDANKQEYVQLMCQMKMTGSIRKQINAFLEGFYELIPRKLISIFNEQELELLISGLPEIDIDDLCKNTEYKNYTRLSEQIQWFWRALRSFDKEDKAKFLQFVTGTSKVPLQGFANLEGMNGFQKFTIQKDTRSTDRLPSAHTCFNQLDLPEYPNYETLHKMLLIACRECSEGFAFA